MPSPGAVEAAMRPLTRRGAPSAMLERHVAVEVGGGEQAANSHDHPQQHGSAMASSNVLALPFRFG
jgi:hypothetical protein